MRPRTDRKSFSLRNLQVCEVVVVLLFTALPALAVTENVVVRQNVSKSDREELALKLRTITGWSELAFNSDGALRIGNAQVDGGSKGARDLLNSTINGNRIILFEDASSRKDVIFCRVVLGKLDQASDADVFIVLIDFDDFRQVSGDKQARAAFDVGWAVLHEIDHVVEDSEDPQANIVGDCEDHINRMRRELGLPIRNSYFFTPLPIKNDSNLISRFVRLGFEQETGPTSKRRRYWLVWDAAVVGGLPDPADITGALNRMN
jgi:hypothetical protein